jgi:hypothetical protein
LESRKEITSVITSCSQHLKEGNDWDSETKEERIGKTASVNTSRRIIPELLESRKEITSVITSCSQHLKEGNDWDSETKEERIGKTASV